MRNRLRLLSLLAGLALVVAACTSGDTGSPETSVEPATTEAPDPSGCENAPEKIGYSPLTMELAWFVVAGKAIEEEAARCGTEVIVADPGLDAAQQALDIENLLGAGVDFLIVFAVDPTAIGPVVEEASDAGVPIIGLASEFEGATTVGWAFKDGGRQSGVCGGEWLLNAKPGEAPYEVAILHGKSSGQNEIDQYDGMIEGLTKTLGADGFVLVAEADTYTEEKGFDDISTALRGNPELDLVVTNNDGGALGAYSAILAEGYTIDDVGVAAAGIDERLLTRIQDGEIICSADSAPDLIGAASVRVAAKLLVGEGVGVTVLIGGETITQDNAVEVSERLYG